MSFVSLNQVEDERRAQKLSAAKKKLKSFRATRTPSSTSSSATSSSSMISRSPLQSTVVPLTTENGGNILGHNRVNSKGKGKAVAMDEILDKGIGIGHQRIRSGVKASGRHRRQVSSVSIQPTSHTLCRPPQDEDPRRIGPGLRLGAEYKFNLPVPREIITIPPTPLVETHDLSDPFISESGPGPSTPPPPQEGDMVKQRLSAFSFGSKPSLSTSLSPISPTASPNRRRTIQKPLSFSFPSSVSDSTIPSAGLDKLAQALQIGTTPSRPPSLLFTNATPLLPSPSAPGRLSHPSISSLAGLESPSPSTPPTAGRRKHSHTRSNSISLANLTLGAPRPISLGIPTSPSFPSSPGPGPPNSPDNPQSGGSGRTGTRLKFEPSEAEMAKEESRRKALEKLTGSSPSSSPIIPDEQTAEISLPDLEDDSSSTASRPLSSAWGGSSTSSSSSSSSSLSFGRPNSINLNSPNPAMELSPFPTWPTDESSPMSFDKWSSGFKEEGLGFGLDIMPKRGSFQGALAVLPEVEETEEEYESEPEDSTPIVQPTPTSRLRELHLLSSGPIASPRETPPRPTPTSPTKAYGTIGRGRPHPLSLSSSSASRPEASGSPLTGTRSTITTPTTAKLSAKRRLSTGRPSSISYKKDNNGENMSQISGSSISSRWSVNSRNMISPPPTEMSLPGISSPPIPSPRTTGWNHVPRSTNRPCPRPRSLVGLGIAHAGSGSGRILSEVLEKDESGEMWGSAAEGNERSFTFRPFGSMDIDISSETGQELERDDDTMWRDNLLEVEMERDALREDVDGWRERCRGLEERLEDEKRESIILKERMRKLSDRLLTLSSTPQSPARTSPIIPTRDNRLIGELKDQLFSLTSAYEHEKREKEIAQQRIFDLESRLIPSHQPPVWSFTPIQSPPSIFQIQQPSSPALVPSQSPYTTPWPSTPIVTPATPALPTPLSPPLSQFNSSPSSDGGDPNSFRMRAWGFPSRDSPPPITSKKNTKENKRESFFGLSKTLSQTKAVEAEMEEDMYDGVDLPPFILPPGLGIELQPSLPGMMRAVSDPISPYHLSGKEMGSEGMVKSKSGSGFSSSAFSLISGYLPTRSGGSPIKSGDGGGRVGLSDQYENRGGGGIPDMTKSCSCCQGDIFEL